MCIIAVKPAGYPIPDETILQNMWSRNPDGAGFMFATNGQVIIQKGLMSYKSFKKALNKVSNPTAVPMIMHFRIATSGGVNPQMTHPFPISTEFNKLAASRTYAPYGLAHNGVLSIGGTKTTSDTAEYVKRIVYPLTQLCPTWYKDDNCLQILEETSTGSRLALLGGDGTITRLGSGWTEDSGIWYSNSSYKVARASSLSSYTKKYSNSYGYNSWKYSTGDWDEDWSYPYYSNYYGYSNYSDWDDDCNTRTETLLMELEEENYVVSPDNEILDDGIYAIDVMGRVYSYNADTFAWDELRDYKAVDRNLKAVQFNCNKAYTELVAY